MVNLLRTHLSLLYWKASRSWNSFWSHQRFPCVAQYLAWTEASQPSIWKPLYEAMKGALDQSVFSSPPLVAQSSAFHRLEYIFIGWLNGKRTPKSLQFLNTLIGMSSTKNLFGNWHHHQSSSYVINVVSFVFFKKNKITCMCAPVGKSFQQSNQLVWQKHQISWKVRTPLALVTSTILRTQENRLFSLLLLRGHNRIRLFSMLLLGINFRVSLLLVGTNRPQIFIYLPTQTSCQIYTCFNSSIFLLDLLLNFWWSFIQHIQAKITNF